MKEKYQKIAKELVEKKRYSNIMAVPKITKVVINTGFGRLVTGKSADEQKKIYNSIIDDVSLISGQRPVLCKAKKSIAAFKIRQGMPIGAKVTLRGKKMYDFIARFINIALPRSRDFKGLSSKAMDKNGNLTVGVKEHIIFPEVSPEKAKNIFGFEVIFSTTAKSSDECIEFLKTMGFPIK